MRTVFHNREIPGLRDWYNPFPFPLVWIPKDICGYVPSNNSGSFPVPCCRPNIRWPSDRIRERFHSGTVLHDSQNSTYKVEDYAFSKLKERYKKWTGNSFDDKDLTSFGLVNEQGNLTNAGALLADESPIRCSRLFCTRWNGLNKSGGADISLL